MRSLFQYQIYLLFAFRYSSPSSASSAASQSSRRRKRLRPLLAAQSSCCSFRSQTVGEVDFPRVQPLSASLHASWDCMGFPGSRAQDAARSHGWCFSSGFHPASWRCRVLCWCSRLPSLVSAFPAAPSSAAEALPRSLAPWSLNSTLIGLIP